MEHQLLKRHPIGNPRRKWRQDNFILSIASPAPLGLAEPSELTRRKTRRAVKTAVDVGFNVLGCLWASPTTAMDIVRAAEGLDATVLFQDLKRFGGMGHKNIFCENNDYAGAMHDTAKWKSVKGYIMWDEPILEEHMAQTRRMIDHCERERPDILPYTVANPDYNRLCYWEDKAYAPYIERFLEVIDPAQMSFDYYPVGRAEYDPALQLDNSTMWSALEVVRTAAQRRDVPFWFYYQGQHFAWHPIDYTFTFPMVRAMAYAGVLHGAKALECYTEFDGYVDPTTGGKGTFFEEHRRLNEELRVLGNTLMALTCLRVIHDDTLLPDHPAMEGLRTPITESELISPEYRLPRRISISEHVDAYGNKYLMVLNRDFESVAHLRIELKQPSNVYGVSREDGEQSLQYDGTQRLPITLAPGDLALYRIQPATETPYTVEYYLDK